MIPIQVLLIPEMFNRRSYRNWHFKHILTEHKPFYAGNGVSKTRDFMMKISKISFIIPVVLSGIFVFSCGQFNTKTANLPQMFQLPLAVQTQPKVLSVLQA